MAPPRTGQAPRPEVVLGASNRYGSEVVLRMDASGHRAPGGHHGPRGGARHGHGRPLRTGRTTAPGGARHGRWRPPRTGQAPRLLGGPRCGQAPQPDLALGSGGRYYPQRWCSARVAFTVAGKAHGSEAALGGQRLVRRIGQATSRTAAWRGS